MGAVTHPRFAPRRGSRPMPWWSKAWSRAVEEAAYHQDELRTGRALARRGAVGSITVGSGSLVAAVTEGDDAWTVQVTVPVLGEEAIAILVELVAAESGRIAELAAGQLPHQLIEDAEDSGVELLPYGSELAAECSCQAWAQPCVHGLAVLTQFTWLINDDPFQLLLLRGLAKETLLARLHRRSVAAAGPSADAGAAGEGAEDEADVDAAYDAAVRAARILQVIESGGDPDHLF